MGERIQKVFEDPYKSSKCESYVQNVNDPSIPHIQFNHGSFVDHYYPFNRTSSTEQNNTFQYYPSNAFYTNNNVPTSFSTTFHPAICKTYQSSTCSSASFVKDCFQSQYSTFHNPHYSHCASNTTNELLSTHFTDSNTVSLNGMSSFSKTMKSTWRSPNLKDIPSVTNRASYFPNTSNPCLSRFVPTVHSHSQGKSRVK
jgi:hypothetical protein